MNRTRTIVVLSVMLAGYVWSIFGSGDWIYTHWRNAPNRAALLKIRGKLQVGDSYEKTLRAYWRNASCDLRLNAESAETWSVVMPFEIGASDWVMYVDFSDGKVSSIRVRTSDGPTPGDGPEDVTTPGISDD
jgi:hypothetical protein